MQIKKQNIKRKKPLAAFILHLMLIGWALAGCTKADIMYRQEANEKGYVIIRPDHEIYALPALSYHFYNMDEETEYLRLACDGRGNFEGYIAPGTYRVMATNTAAQGVAFGELTDHQTAVVQLLPAAITRSYTLFSQPEKVFSITLGDFTIEMGDTVTYTPSPVLLTKVVTISFTLKGTLQQQVTGIDGILRGIYQAIRLYSCQPTDASLVESSGNAVGFSILEDMGSWQTSVNLFGLCDPEYGQAYQNLLDISLTMTDHTVRKMEIDLTDKLSDIIKENQGVIPIELPLEIEIEEGGDDEEQQLTATIKVGKWKEGGETEIKFP